MSKQDGFDLTRRKILAGIGGIGVASAGAGLGTSAYFSDAETFEGNTLTAGELALYGSWQQVYYGASDEQRPEDYGTAGRPWVNAFPDHDENGIQSYGDRTYVDDADDDPEDGANLQLTCGELDGLGEAPRPVIELGDVKPGDSGEVTFGLNLCDNPGYLWMNSSIESETAGSNPNTGESGDLADHMLGKIWRDENCDNVRDELEPSDILLLVDSSGSMFYDRYGGRVSDDPVAVGDEYGEITHDETTKIDLVEQGIVEFVDLLSTNVDEDDEIEAGDFRVGAVFFDGYSDDDSEVPNVDTVAFEDDLDSLVTLDDGDAPLRNLRQKVADLVGGTTDPDDHAGGIDTGTALEEAYEEAIALYDARTDDSRAPQSVTFTDGEPYEHGANSIPDERFEDLIDVAADVRDGDDVQSNIFVIGDETSEVEAQFTQKVIAGPAGVPIDVAGALGDLTGNPLAYGGDPSFFFELGSPGAIPGVFARVAAEILPESVLTCGPLSSVLQNLEGDLGQQLLPTPRLPEADDCFDAEGTHCVGFSWEFPVRSRDSGADLDNNDVQGAELEFDLGFYTEQCRHNDDPGQTAD